MKINRKNREILPAQTMMSQRLYANCGDTAALTALYIFTDIMTNAFVIKSRRRGGKPLANHNTSKAEPRRTSPIAVIAPRWHQSDLPKITDVDIQDFDGSDSEVSSGVNCIRAIIRMISRFGTLRWNFICTRRRIAVANWVSSNDTLGDDLWHDKFMRMMTTRSASRRTEMLTGMMTSSSDSYTSISCK